MRRAMLAHLVQVVTATFPFPFTRLIALPLRSFLPPRCASRGEEAIEPLLRRVREKMVCQVLPPRRLRINRREVKQVYNTYKPKKRHLPPPVPFEPEEQFLDFVELLDPLASLATAERTLK